MEFFDKLKTFYRAHELISIYADDSDPSYAYYGYIQGMDETHLLLSAIHPEGRNFGLVLFKTDDILNFETDNREIQRIRKLTELYHITPTEITLPKGKNVLLSTLQYVAEKNMVCALESIPDQLVTGFIKLEGNLVEMTELDRFGNVYGKCYYDIDNIWRIWIESPEELARKLLYENQ